MTYDLTPAQAATIIVTLENRLLVVKRDYEDAMDTGERPEPYRDMRDSLYSAIRALQPERPCLPENREMAGYRRFR